VPCIVVLAINRKRIKEILPTRKMGTKNYLMIIAMSLAIQPLLVLISTILGQFLPATSSEMLDNMNMEANFFLVLLFIGVVPSILEELAFRGIIFSGYKDVPIFKAALLNGVLFGLMHLNFHQFFYTAVLGFTLCLFVYYTKSILSAMLAHFVVNGTQVGLSLLQLRSRQELAYYDEPSVFLTLIILGLIAVAGLTVFAFVFMKFKSHNITDNDRPEDAMEPDGAASPLPAKPHALLTVPVYITIALFVLFALITLLPPIPHQCPYC